MIYVAPDGVLFLGDCLYGSIKAPVGSYTHERLLPLTTKLLDLDAAQAISGHSTSVMDRAELEPRLRDLQLAARLVERLGADETAVLAAAQAERGAPPDENMARAIRALIAELDGS